MVVHTLIPALRRQSHENQKVEASLGYVGYLRSVWDLSYTPHTYTHWGRERESERERERQRLLQGSSHVSGLTGDKPCRLEGKRP